jgi:hypothetical protein
VELWPLVMLLVIAVLVAIVGFAFGIFFLAPRLTRLADRLAEDERDRDD